MDAAPRRSPPFRRGTRAYVLHYLRGRAPAFAALLLLVTAAACCAVAVQYTMKLLVDAVAAGPRDDNPAVWWALYLFIGLIVAEGLLQRLSGWLGCRTTVALGIDVRLDLFDHLNGQPMRYFADTLAGSLGSRITATAGSFAALAPAVIGQILLYGAAALALRNKWGGRDGRRHVLSTLRRVAVVFATVPVATFLANLVPWWRAGNDLAAVVAIVLVWVAVISAVALRK